MNLVRISLGLVQGSKVLYKSKLSSLRRYDISTNMIAPAYLFFSFFFFFPIYFFILVSFGEVEQKVYVQLKKDFIFQPCYIGKLILVRNSVLKTSSSKFDYNNRN